LLVLPLPFRRASVVAGLCLGLLAPAHAQSPAPVSLRQALDAAWALSPAARAATSRQAELQARAGAARALLSGSPSATLAHRTDRLQTNAGLREYEAEVGLPLWNPGMRQATQRQVAADTALLDQQNTLARLKLAGELREAAGQLAALQAEQALAARKLDEANRLAGDTERRVKAGDTARVDLLQTQGAARQAESALAQADAALSRARGHWRSLTGLNADPAWSEQPGTAADHPGLLAAQAQVRSAQTRLALTDADRRDPMELGVGVTRERAAAGAPGETTMRFALRIPFGGDTRNAAKLAAARAELDAAQAEADALQRQIDAERESAQVQLDAARRNEVLTAQRAALAGQAQALIAKAHQLGEADLPTRMRADNDKYDADLALARARIDTLRAIAQLNQAFGLLP
jgi:cobalt-zinc-cadmium efflux system outer membrane protein